MSDVIPRLEPFRVDEYARLVAASRTIAELDLFARILERRVMHDRSDPR